jgi:hypothetical protein
MSTSYTNIKTTDLYKILEVERPNYQVDKFLIENDLKIIPFVSDILGWRTIGISTAELGTEKYITLHTGPTAWLAEFNINCIISSSLTVILADMDCPEAYLIEGLAEDLQQVIEKFIRLLYNCGYFKDNFHDMY